MAILSPGLSISGFVIAIGFFRGRFASFYQNENHIGGQCANKGGGEKNNGVQLSIFEYIEGYYNSKRPHGTLNMLTPNEAEALYWEQHA